MTTPLDQILLPLDWEHPISRHGCTACFHAFYAHGQQEVHCPRAACGGLAKPISHWGPVPGKFDRTRRGGPPVREPPGYSCLSVPVPYSLAFASSLVSSCFMSRMHSWVSAGFWAGGGGAELKL